VNARFTRRAFLGRSLAAAGGLAFPHIVPASVLGRDGAVAPSERIVLGGIGLGPRGRYVLSVMLPEPDVQFVAVCDVQRTRREAVKDMVDEHYENGDCATYRDFFALLDRSDIDAVLVATGDHWHALASILSMRAGKDVYSEKPCGMTIAEVQALSDAADRYARVFQAGTQRRSLANFQYAVYLARSGKLGSLHTLHASVYVPSRTYAWLPPEPEPPVEECDWDRWLGPSPWRPYNGAYVSGGWRGHYDFEAAANLPDWGAHTIDLCQWANEADDTVPLEWEADERGITGVYENGVKLVCDFLETPFADRSPQYTTSTGTCPVRFEGDEGWVETGDNGEVLLSENLVRSQGRRFARPGTNPRGHGRNFFDCVKSRARPAAHQGVMRHSHVACFSAELAWELGRKVRVDPARERFVDDEEANRRIRRAPREPWSFDV
jgi:hypothetical protein